MELSTLLKLYKRQDIQNGIIKHVKDREVAIKFGDSGFGKRPDTLKYPRDILELAKQGATSFHFSEELWKNPLQLDPMMKKKEQEDLRIGWDLVLDVDFVEWEATKLITKSLIDALKKNGVSSISCKFSGNKGFHIGVPFEAFPKKVKSEETRLLFPEGVRRIASYLMDIIDNKENSYALSNKIIESKSFQDFLKKNRKNIDEFAKEICSNCGYPMKLKKEKGDVEFICSYCDYRSVSDDKFQVCPKCKKIMQRIEKSKDKKCLHCKGNKFITKIDLAIDTLLISSRHLFRSAYSYHEKSGLVSIPIDPEKVIEFDKKDAKPERVIAGKYNFLDRNNIKSGEASQLITEAFDHKPVIETLRLKKEKEYEIPKSALQEQFFPPCIQIGLSGLEDGRKRYMFILVNFLVSVGWDYDQIEKKLREWNKKNHEPLRENLIVSHIRYHKQQKKKILPPNCNNMMYYKDMALCKPDNLCKRIKNPVNYSRIKTKYLKS